MKLKEVLKEECDKKELDYELYQSISNSVFKELAYKYKNPSDLIIYLEKIGKFYGRKKKTEDGVLKFTHILNNPSKITNIENITKTRETLNFILDKYTDFYNDKNQHKNANINDKK